MACFHASQPAATSYAGVIGDALNSQVNLAPDLYNAEAGYQPKYAALSANNLTGLINGTLPGQTEGLQQAQNEANTSQRTNDFQNLAMLAPQAQQVVASGTSPDQQNLLSLLNQSAASGLAAGSSLTPDQQRQMQQSSRAAFAARGMVGSGAGLSDELLRQFNLGQQLLSQRQQFGQSMAGTNYQTQTSPYLSLLTGVGTGQSNALQQAGSAMGMAGPSLFNPQSQEAGAIAAGNASYNAMFANPSTMDQIGAVSKPIGSLIGGIAGGMM